jgi:hypothetical protein
MTGHYTVIGTSSGLYEPESKIYETLAQFRNLGNACSFSFERPQAVKPLKLAPNTLCEKQALNEDLHIYTVTRPQDKMAQMLVAAAR